MTSVLAFTLRSLRVAAGLSQNALAKRAGIDPAFVNRIEHNKRADRPSRATLDALIAVMGLSDVDAGRLLTAGGYWPWSLSPEDTRLLLEIGVRVAAASAAAGKEQTA